MFSINVQILIFILLFVSLSYHEKKKKNKHLSFYEFINNDLQILTKKNILVGVLAGVAWVVIEMTYSYLKMTSATNKLVSHHKISSGLQSNIQWNLMHFFLSSFVFMYIGELFDETKSPTWTHGVGILVGSWFTYVMLIQYHKQLKV